MTKTKEDRLLTGLIKTLDEESPLSTCDQAARRWRRVPWNASTRISTRSSRSCL